MLLVWCLTLLRRTWSIEWFNSSHSELSLRARSCYVSVCLEAFFHPLGFWLSLLITCWLLNFQLPLIIHRVPTQRNWGVMGTQMLLPWLWYCPPCSIGEIYGNSFPMEAICGQNLMQMTHKLDLFMLPQKCGAAYVLSFIYNNLPVSWGVCLANATI